MTRTLPARFSHLRLRDLMLLEHVADLGSLSDAARHLHVSQSAITQALQGLEQAVGATLVERGRRGQRGVRLTPSGLAALARLRIARHELLAALDAAGTPAVVPLRIGALPLATLSLLPDALVRLRLALPSVQIELVESTVAGLWHQLRRGELDVIVSRLPAMTEQQLLPEGMFHETVGHETLVLVCAASDPLARRRKPALGQLQRASWVLPPIGTFTRMAFDQLFVRAGLAPPAPVITSASFHANLRLAAGGGLLALAPRSAVMDVAAALGLKTITQAWSEEGTEIVLACRTASLDNPGVSALRQSFRAA